MKFTNNGERYYNSNRFKTSNGRSDTSLSVDDLDFDTGGGQNPNVTKTAEEIETERLEKEKLEKEKSSSSLIKDVENDYIKTLDETKLNELITKANGAGFDKSGNIVDSSGVIIKTIEDIEKEKEDSTSNVLDGVNEVTLLDDKGKEIKYKLDENKNAVDNEGKIVKTKEELIALTNESDKADEDDYIKHISSSTGFHAVDDKGEPINFENTLEGLAAREAHIVKQEATKLAFDEINAFFDKNPDILEMLEYKKLNGSLKDYAVHEDYSRIIIEDTNDDQHKSIIVKAEMARGNTEERARRIAELLTQDGKGKTEAEASLKYLVDKQNADKQAKLTKIDNDKKANLAKQEEQFSKVATIIKSGKVKDFTIPEFFKAKLSDGRETTFHRNAIFQLITQPVDDKGNTRYDLMRSKDSAEDMVLDAYLRLVKYDTSQLVMQRSNNNKVLKLKESKQSASKQVILHKANQAVDASDIA